MAGVGASVTGESIPVEATAGASVFASSINQSGALEIAAKRIGRNKSYGTVDPRSEDSRGKAIVAYAASLSDFACGWS